jgi:ATP-dependent Lon protease
LKVLPLSYDRNVLSSPSLMYEDAAGRLKKVLRAVVERRVLPWFETQPGVDPVQLARAAERVSLARLEDFQGALDLVSLVAEREAGWTVHIHERIFDYFAFGLPLNPLQAFESPTREARKVLALAEFVLRHEFDHIVRPHREERQVLAADCEYLRHCREHEPALHQALIEAFLDRSNGLQTSSWIELLECFERRDSFDDVAGRMIRDHMPRLCGLPAPLLAGAFMTMAPAEQEPLLDECYRLITDSLRPAVRRAADLDKLVELFAHQRRSDLIALRRTFDGCLERWHEADFLRELEIEAGDGDREALFERFLSRISRPQAAPAAAPAAPAPRPEPSLESPLLEGGRAPGSSLRDRIEAARSDPRVPRSVIRAIDNNVDNIEGHSKAKYTEFIETLLTVPWGSVDPIEVGPREFSAGLETSHFGLDKPKELVTDFFANLIWRYREFDRDRPEDWHRSGSAFLFVGPPGVGKTSFAISIANSLGIPFHKVSLGGMRDESALRGHGFTYEGSKPGAIVQGLIKMGTMNGMFILDEADKTEAFAIATLLEILDPEQNNLFHDKYTQTTVDIDLSNCHFVLTANTLDTVPAPVIDRCQVIHLDRYSIDEKVEIARRHIIPRLRQRHRITAEMIDFDPGFEDEHLRFLIRTYTHEAGVRQLELELRTLLLRLQRRFLLEGGGERVAISHQLIRQCLDEPAPPARINADDRIGEVLALGVNAERGVGGVIPVQATRILGRHDDHAGTVSLVHATGNLEKVMDESRRVATTAILHCAERLGIERERIEEPVHLHLMGGSTRKDGPSAGLAIALALASLFSGRPLRRDVAATGEIDTQGRITGIGGLDVKLETAVHAGCKTLIIPRDNLSGPGGVASLPDALRSELQVLDIAEWRAPHEPFDARRHTIQIVAVDHIADALDIAAIDERDLAAVEEAFVRHARQTAAQQDAGIGCPMTVLVKSAGELDPEHFASERCASCRGCRLLVLPAAGDEVEARARAGGGSDVRVVGEQPEALRAALAEAIGGSGDEEGPCALVAPYFALKGIPADSIDPARRLDLLANNYVAQGYKLKASKPVLNRTACRLLHLDRAALESCPFLSREDGVWVADLKLVPEKYRLDPGRCEELLDRLLGAWLRVADEAALGAAS